MTKDKAKEILTLYRPGTADGDEPEFGEALDLARQDAELGRWLGDHCTQYEALRAKFRQLPVPDGLKEQILSERRVRLSPWRRPQWLATAVAALALAAVIGALILWPDHGEKDNLASLLTSALRKSVKEYPVMDLETSDLSQIHQHLAKLGHGNYVLPAGLSKTSPTGCAVFPWHGKPVSMLCFSSRAKALPATPDLFLFVVDRAAIVDPPAQSALTFTPGQHYSSVTWSDEKKAYVMVGLGTEDFLRKYLDPASAH